RSIQHISCPYEQHHLTGATWNPAPIRHDSRAISLPALSPNNPNGPPEKPADRHERSRLSGGPPPIDAQVAWRYETNRSEWKIERRFSGQKSMEP
ncbi:hypothetical protein, partial [Actinacidiphila epipremni]|uniref:hypothetical protein n=1 Tax=Actinacidiphila epipremni TaxID=2053013 RepID=UPI0019D1BF08